MNQDIPFNNHTLDSIGFRNSEPEIRTAMDTLAQEVGEETAKELIGLLDKVIADRAREEAVHAVATIMLVFASQSTMCAAIYHLLMPEKKSLSQLARPLSVSKQAIYKQQQELLRKMPGGMKSVSQALGIKPKKRGSFSGKIS